MQQTITLIGYLTSNPHTKTFPSGSQLTRFRIATSRKVRKPGAYEESRLYSGEEDDGYVDRDRLFIDVECWGTLAENTHASLMKGKPVICVGYLNTQQWQDNSGNSQSKVILRAIFVGFELRNYVVNYRRNPVPINAVQGADLSKYNAPESPADYSEQTPQEVVAAEVVDEAPSTSVVQLHGVQLPAEEFLVATQGGVVP